MNDPAHLGRMAETWTPLERPIKADEMGDEIGPITINAYGKWDNTNCPPEYGMRARLNLSLHPPRRPLRLRRWALILAIAVTAGVVIHAAAKGMPQAALDAVIYEGTR